MNYAEDLYKNVKDRVNDEESSFENKIVNHEGGTYEIFNYRIVASYYDWLKPGALECRGLMFRIDGDTPELVSHPFEKFFNYQENPLTANVDLTQADRICRKEDGTMISTYLKADGNLGLKTKKTLDSIFVEEAERFLKKDMMFWMDLWTLAQEGYTTIMEWVSPRNRIVLPYQKDNLVVLAIRSHKDGSYATQDALQEFMSLSGHMMGDVRGSVSNDLTEFVARVPTMEDIEGFVFYMPDGQKVKYKTNWYLARHSLLDGLYSPRRVYESIVQETADDAKSLFHNDPAKLEIIEQMERRVKHELHMVVSSVELFYNSNKELDRRDYAIRAQEKNDGLMSLYMNRYLGRDIDYKEWMIKNSRRYIDSDGRWIGADV